MKQTNFIFQRYFLALILLFNIGLGAKLKAQEIPEALVQMEAALDTLNGEARYSHLMTLARSFAEVDIPKSRTFITEASNLAQKINRPDFHARALNGMGITYFIQGNLDSALLFYEQSLEVNLANNDSTGLAINYSNLSNIRVELGDFNQAISYFFKGLELARIKGDSATMGDIRNNLGRLYKQLKMYDESIAQMRMAIDIYKKIGENDFIAYYNNLGITYDNQGNYDSALYFYRACIKSANEVHQKPGLFLACTNIAQTFGSLGVLDSARYYVNLALNDSDLAKFPKYAQMVRISHARVLLDEKRYQACVDACRELLKEVLPEGRTKELLGVYKMIQDAYASLGQYQEAYDYLARYTILQDSLNNEDVVSQLARLQERYEYQIEKERLEADHQVELKEERTARLRTYFTIALLGLVILALIVVLAIRRKRNLVLRAKNQEIEKQNLEIQEQGEELRVQKQNLEALNSFKDRVLAVMAHDLKSPLNSLQGLLDLSVMDDVGDPSIIKEMMAKLAAQLVVVRQSVENLLNWARLQLGATGTGNTQEIQLNEAIVEVLGLYKGMVANKSLQVQVEIEDHESKLKADPEIIRIVLRNLISNALKFSPAKGEVQIKGQAQDGHYRLSVKDQGPGLKPEQKAEMFAEMMESTLGTGKEKGSGLGLYLSSSFIRAAGGKIGVISEEGKGAEFWFSLPV